MTNMLELSHYENRYREDCLALFDSNVPKFFGTSERDEFARFLEKFPASYLVGHEHGAVVAAGGYAPHRTEPGSWILCWGMVAARRHRQGLGQVLLEARLRLLAATPQIKAIYLNTSQHSAGFFERSGFTITRTIPDGHAPRIDLCEMKLAAGKLQKCRVGRKRRIERHVPMTVIFPPLIKPDGRFSRIRLSEFH